MRGERNAYAHVYARDWKCNEIKGLCYALGPFGDIMGRVLGVLGRWMLDARAFSATLSTISARYAYFLD